MTDPDPIHFTSVCLAPKKTLYRYSAGRMNVWEIHVEEFTIITQWGVFGGEFQENSELIPFGKGGRTRVEQIDHRIKSMIAKRIDKGYCYDKETAIAREGTGALGFAKPMLASKYPGVVAYARGNSIQPKFDGHRCLITKRDGRIVAYSRNGKPIDTIVEILSEIKLEEGQTIDGELYKHGTPLQELTSLIKKRQAGTQLLKYIVYDFISSDFYPDRYNTLMDIIRITPYVMIASTVFDFDPKDVPDYMMNHIKNGYEGSIIRLGNYPYENKRSKGLLKVKNFLDDEFLVRDIYLSPKDVPIIQCETKEGKIFTVTAHGGHHARAMIYKARESHIGKLLTIKYAGLTNDEIPFHPIAIAFRED